jgi:hypothetical protein
MPVPVQNITQGKCFRTKSNQVRYVESITGQTIRFRPRGGSHYKGWETKVSYQDQDLQTFAKDVDEEVPCHWDPNFVPLKP